MCEVRVVTDVYYEVSIFIDEERSGVFGKFINQEIKFVFKKF